MNARLRSSKIPFVLAALVALGVSGAAQPTPPFKRVATQKLVVAKIGSFKQATLTVSADGRRFAYGRKEKGGYAVVVDGRVEATHKNLGPIVWWAPDAGAVLNAYAKWGFDELAGIKPMAFSADSKHLAYGAKEGDSWLIVRDGQKGKPFKYVGGPVLSRDGQHLAHAAKVVDGWCVVVDGIEGKAYEKVGPPVFSPDGRRLAYAARQKGSEMMVVDGVEGKPYESLDAPPVYSNALGFLTRVAFRNILPAFPAFSLDGRLGYMAKQGGKWHAVVEGNESEPFDELRALIFSPDGRHLAFAGRRAGGVAMIVDGRAVGTHEAVTLPAFSGDGNRITYAAKTEKQWAAVVDGTVLSAHADLGQPVFSPDGSRIAYAAKTGKQWAVVVDGTAQKAYEAIGLPVFSPDGGRVAYPAARTQRNWAVVVNGVEGNEYEGLVKGSNVVFDDSTHFHYLVVSQDQILLVEEEMQPTPGGNAPEGPSPEGSLPPQDRHSTDSTRRQR